MTGAIAQLRVKDGWERSLVLKRDGTPVNVPGNAILYMANSDCWKGLRYNKFHDEAEIKNPPRIDGWAPPNSRLDDFSVSFIAHWLHIHTGIKLTMDAVYRVADTVSRFPGHAYHPVRDYLTSLEWDGVRRLERWAPDYLRAEDSPYTRQVGRMWLVSAVARVMQPGCGAKHTIILEGVQDAGKSGAIKAMCPREEWLHDSPLKIGDTDGMHALRGKWIVELGELDSLRGREASRVKQYLSQSSDTYRRAYGRTFERHARQTVFAGSTNEYQYLNDPTGNVRFWPIQVGVHTHWQVDFAAIERDRDQFWAEAVADYYDGFSWDRVDPDLMPEVRLEQEAREQSEPWEAVFSEWLLGNEGKLRAAQGVTTHQILKDVFEVPLKDMTRGHETRVGIILRRAGFVVANKSERPRRYVRESDE